MHVAVHHIITDTQKWEQVTKNMMAALEQGRLPQGLKALMYLPGSDGRKADCLWEAQSVDGLKSFLEPQTSSAARNEYFQINSGAAIGLPGQEEVRKAA
jgi:DNA polymerase/3'-5' exonuclease PolX